MDVNSPTKDLPWLPGQWIWPLPSLNHGPNTFLLIESQAAVKTLYSLILRTRSVMNICDADLVYFN